jgi:hypothetical protein
MPTYSFTHHESGETIEQHFPVDERPNSIVRNGLRYDYDFVASVRTVRTPPPMYPQRSEALACSPHEVDEYRRAFPKHDYDDEGRPLVRSKRHREQLAKELGVDSDSQAAQKAANRRSLKPDVR